MTEILSRVWRSVGAGAVMGAVVATGIVIIGLLNGSRLITMRGGLQYDWVTLAIAYLAASFLGGLLVGLLQPLARVKLGAAMIGAAVGALFGVGIHYSARPVEAWDTRQAVLVALVALALGAPLGLSYREIFSRRRRRRGASRHRAV